MLNVPGCQKPVWSLSFFLALQTATIVERTRTGAAAAAAAAPINRIINLHHFFACPAARALCYAMRSWFHKGNRLTKPRPRTDGPYVLTNSQSQQPVFHQTSSRHSPERTAVSRWWWTWMQLPFPLRIRVHSSLRLDCGHRNSGPSRINAPFSFCRRQWVVSVFCHHECHMRNGKGLPGKTCSRNDL